MRPELPSTTGPSGVLQVMPRLLSGLALCGTGIALMIRADLGLGPWDVLHQGLSLAMGISIGAATILVGLLVLLLWFPLRERPGIGTLANVLLIGVFLDVALRLTQDPGPLWLRWTLLLVSVPVFGLGIALYIGAGVGSGPRDGIMTGLARRGVPVALARTVIELSALLAGWLLGGTVGIGTVYFALGTGPMLHVLLPRLRAPWYPEGSQPRVLGGTPR